MLSFRECWGQERNELLYTVRVVPQEWDWDWERIELLYTVCVVLQERDWDWERIELLYTVCVVLQERDWDRERIELLTEENARLEFEKKTSMNESASLEQELEDARTKVGSES